MIAFWLYVVLSLVWLGIAFLLLLLQGPLAIIGWIMIAIWALATVGIFLG